MPAFLRTQWLYLTGEILVTDLHTFSCSISWENLPTDQSNFPLVIILFILITCSLECVLIL